MRRGNRLFRYPSGHKTRKQLQNSAEVLAGRCLLKKAKLLQDKKAQTRNFSPVQDKLQNPGPVNIRPGFFMSPPRYYSAIPAESRDIQQPGWPALPQHVLNLLILR